MDTNTTHELIVDAKVDNLPLVNEFVEKIMTPLEPSMKVQMQIDLVVEEIFVNIANYAYGDGLGKAILQVRVLEAPLAIEIVFMDEGMPYNPLEREEPDPDQALEDRKIGGWGIFLVKKNVDEVNYNFAEGKNILTLRKKIN